MYGDNITFENMKIDDDMLILYQNEPNNVLNWAFCINLYARIYMILRSRLPIGKMGKMGMI